MSKGLDNQPGRGFMARAGAVFAALGAAGASASALEGGRRPRARDLRALGIDPAGFDTIRLS